MKKDKILNDTYVVFDLEKMLSFEGETGPYAQYTHARACSILRKAGVDSIEGSVDTTLLTDEASVNVCKALDEFPAKFVDAAEKNEPYIITRHIIEICKTFNKFYNENNIMNSEGELKKARLAVVMAVRDAIKKGLKQ